MTVSLDKSTDATTTDTVEGPSTLDILKEQLAALVAKTEAVQGFKSGNTGVRTALTLKAPDARALGLLMPKGSKLVMSVSAYIVDPANSPDA